VSKARFHAHGLAELAALRAALRPARVQAAASVSREPDRAAQDNPAHVLFAAAVGPVNPLRKPASRRPERARPPPIARQRLHDEARVLEQSMSDEFDAEWLLETDDSLSFRRRGVGGDVLRKLRRGVWLTQGQIDLHGLRRDAARERLLAFLRDARQSGWRCVRVVHGKGNGSPGRVSVLKSKVRGWLVQRDDVIAFVQARATDGGHGAVLVLLRPHPTGPSPDSAQVPR
jgi:DNA-nicking Smr family endonuclease